MNQSGKVLGGILLVSGTTIGAGMLALPVCTGLAGFYPSVILMIAYWMFMTFTALLFLEVNLWMEDPHANIISMAKKTLGPWAQVASWIVYLFLLYSLTTAYIAGGGALVIDVISETTGLAIPAWFGPLPLLILFGYFVFRGTKSVDYINRILMFGLLVTYLALMVKLYPETHTNFLSRIDWKYFLFGVSVVSTSFGFHIIIPTLTTYLERDVKQLKKVILIGSFIPLIVYLIWNYLSLAIIPSEGEFCLHTGYLKGSTAVQLISYVLHNSAITHIAQAFSIFAIVTSFLGVSLSLMAFLGDGLKVKPTLQGRTSLFLLTFLPPLIVTYINPRAFLSALEFAGAFGVVLLLAVLPALMVWKGREQTHKKLLYKAPGGTGALVAVLGISALVVGIEIANRAGLLKHLLERS